MNINPKIFSAIVFTHIYNTDTWLKRLHKGAVVVDCGFSYIPGTVSKTIFKNGRNISGYPYIYNNLFHFINDIQNTEVGEKW